MRLIDADALAKFIDYGHLNNPNEKLYSENDIREMIDMMPTVDAVPVIRCKDCAYLGHWGATNFDGVDTGYLCSRTEDNEIELTSYCSMARRRDE